MNALQPGSIKDIYTGGLPFKKMENISKFLGTCPGYGVRQSDIFQVRCSARKGVFCPPSCLRFKPSPISFSPH